jgi:TolB protein
MGAFMKAFALYLLLLTAIMIAGCSRGRTVGRIAFQSNRDGNFEIYTMVGDGSNQQRMTYSQANDVSPCWSPDGSTIVFASDRDGNWEIYSVGLDTSSLKRLTNGLGANTAPSWAMGGSKILFVSSRDAVNGELYLMNPDGSNVERVTHDSYVKDSPFMMPDGKSIIMTVNYKGKNVIAAYSLTDKSTVLITSPEHNSLDPRISEDGSLVTFTSDQGGNYEIYTMAPAGGNQTRITTSEHTDCYTPTWLSGASEIMYVKKGGIYLLSLEKKEEHLISNSGDRAPHWISR